MIRVHGDVRRINVEALDHKQVHGMVYDIMNDGQRKHYEEFLEIDFSFEIDGLALIGGRQTADTHTLVDHAKAHGICKQTHKTIVGGAGHAVFNGKVFVREGAQLTDSSQQSRNLLLSDKARVDTKPQLEIYADDVKCAHGAAVGQLDAEHLFYLKSRGLPEAQARNLLTYAFGAEIIDHIPVPSLVDALEKLVMARTEASL
jgi:Fe-S cluster assembly protein SufD